MAGRPKNNGWETKVKIIDFISRYTDMNGRTPTIRQIGDAIGIKSTSSIWYHLEQMGFAGDRGTWENNKKELEKSLVCPCCQRPLSPL